MNPVALILVLASALIHALWNLIIKTSGGGPVFIWLFTTIYSVVLVPMALIAWFLRPHEITFLGCFFIGGTSLIHLFYFLALQRGYQAGDLSLVYPIARGLGPGLATASAIILLGERPSSLALFGLGLVVLGVVILAFPRGPVHQAQSGVFYGAVTGVLISTYTVWDKYAVDVLRVPPLMLQAFAGLGISLALTPHALRRWSHVKNLWNNHRRAVIGVAVLAPASYLLILVAMSFTPLSYVAPVREISILFAAILGTRFLDEGDTARRLVGACSMVGGVAALALG